MNTTALLADMRTTLHGHRNLAECVLRTIELSDFGSTLTMRFTCPWDSRGQRAGDDDMAIISLQLGSVQELHLTNRLRPNVIANPSELAWSHAEVAMVSIDSDARSALHADHSVPCYVLTVFREDGPWLVAVFSSMSVDS